MRVIGIRKHWAKALHSHMRLVVLVTDVASATSASSQLSTRFPMICGREVRSPPEVEIVIWIVINEIKYAERVLL